MTHKQPANNMHLKYFVLFLFIFSAYGEFFRNFEIQDKAKWTVFVYMNGDNDLEISITGGVTNDKYSRNPIKNNKTISRTNQIVIPGDFHFELANLGSNDNVHVVALVDRVPGYSDYMDNWTNTRFYYIHQGDFPDDTRGTYWVNVSGSDEMNMGDPSTLSWFIQTAQKYFPAEYYYLSMWDHNWGWHDGEFEVDFTNNRDTLSYGDIRIELQKDKNLFSTIDVIGYDACVSAQIEVLHTWRPYANNYAGSQDYVNDGGVNYATVIRTLYENPEITPQSLSEIIATTMMTDPEDGCASAFKLDQTFDNLVNTVDTLANLFILHLNDIRGRLIKIRSSVAQTPRESDDEFHRDLYGVAEQTYECLYDYPDIVQASKELMIAFNETLTYNKVSDTVDSCIGGRGLTIYWTKENENPTFDYYETSFAMATHWDEFLDEF